MCEIYLITNNITGKKYIGQTVSKLSSGRNYGTLNRWRKHCRDSGCRYLHNAIEKYGKENFTVEILLRCDKDTVDMLERKFISGFNTRYPHGYNIESGGTECKELHDETKDKISAGHRFRCMDEDTKQSIITIMKELNIETLPRGIQYTSNKKYNYFGFCSFYDKSHRMCFHAQGLTLKEKLVRALTYYELCRSGNEAELILFKKEMRIDNQKQINKVRKRSIVTIQAMKETGVTELPIGIQYNCISKIFSLKQNNKSKSFPADSPAQSLKNIIDYLHSTTGVGQRDGPSSQ